MIDLRTKRNAFGLIVPTALVALAVGLVAPAALAGPRQCLAQNTSTNSHYSALSDAIAAASAGDTITVNGACHGNFAIDKDLTLQGQGTNPALDGDSLGRVLTITGGTTTLNDLSITHGKTSNAGGGIYVSSAAALDNVVVRENVAGRNNFGGGIEVDGADLTLMNSTVKENTAGSSGGIDIAFGNVTLNNSTVTENAAKSALTDGCAFGDVVYSCAGGIWNYHGMLALENSTVNANTAGYRGGGLRNDATFVSGSPTDGVLILSGSTTIESNKTRNQGGGIWASGRVANTSPPPTFVPFDPNGSVQAADGTATYKDPVNNTTLPLWTGSVFGNAPDQCFPVLTIGTFSCS